MQITFKYISMSTNSADPTSTKEAEEAFAKYMTEVLKYLQGCHFTWKPEKNEKTWNF